MKFDEIKVGDLFFHLYRWISGKVLVPVIVTGFVYHRNIKHVSLHWISDQLSPSWNGDCDEPAWNALTLIPAKDIDNYEI